MRAPLSSDKSASNKKLLRSLKLPPLHNSDPYARVKKLFPRPLQKLYTHFTRYRLEKFVAKSVVSTATDKQYANHVFNPETVNKLSIDKLIKGANAKTWKCSLVNEFFRLAQGVGRLRQAIENFNAPTHYSLYLVPGCLAMLK